MAEDKKEDKKKKHKLDRQSRLLVVLATVFLTLWVLGFHGPWIAGIVALVGWGLVFYPFLSVK